MKNLIIIIALLIVNFAFSQTKNFIDQPYLETSADSDTLVIPDKIYLKITISENDTKNKKSVEELENIMVLKLKTLGIDTNKQLLMNDLESSYKKYALKSTDVMKTKSYDLLVFDGLTAGKVIQELEKEDISNIQLLKTQHSQQEKILADLKKRAIIKAKKNANNIANAIGQKVGNAIHIKTLETSNVNQLMTRGVNTLGYSNKMKEEFEPADLNFRKIRFSASLSVKFKLE